MIGMQVAEGLADAVNGIKTMDNVSIREDLQRRLSEIAWDYNQAMAEELGFPLRTDKEADIETAMEAIRKSS